jgi:hypothetical protein
MNRLRKPEQLYVATKTVHSNTSNGLRPLIARGEVLPGNHSRVKQHPEAFEEAPEVMRGPSPGPGEAVAIAVTAFIASDGKWVWPQNRYHLYDQLVRECPGFFMKQVPPE